MSEKQKNPLNKKVGKPMPLAQNQTGKRGIEPEEIHRTGGNRVSDQGGGKPKGANRQRSAAPQRPG